MRGSFSFFDSLFHRRKRQHFPRLFVGSFLLVVTTIALTALAFFLTEKYSQPTELARVLPADETFAFLSLSTDRTSADYAALTALFSDPTTSLFTALDLGALPLPATLAPRSFLGERLGIAFFGSSFSPQQYAVFFDQADDTSDVFTNLDLRENYLGTDIFSLAGEAVFFQIQNDLVVAADVAIARAVLDTAAGARASLSHRADFAQLRAKAHPRGAGFVYLSSAAVRAATLTQLGGLKYALGSAATDLFSSAAAALTPTADGLHVRFFFPLKKDFARLGGFAPRADFAGRLVDLAPTDLAWLYTTTDLADEFTTLTPVIGGSRAVLFSGALSSFLTQRFGVSDATLAAFSRDEFVVGKTRDEELLALGRLAPADFAALTAELAAGAGTDFSVVEKFTLPDGTTGERLVATPARTELRRYGDVAVTRFIFSSTRSLFAVQVGEIAIFSTSEATLATTLDRLTTAEASGFRALAAAADFAADDFFFTRIESELPQLAPFSYLLGGRAMDAAGLSIRIFLGL